MQSEQIEIIKIIKFRNWILLYVFILNCIILLSVSWGYTKHRIFPIVNYIYI